MTPFEEKLYMIGIGGAIGFASSLLTLIVKALLDHMKERHAIRKEHSIWTTFRNLDKEIPDDHPLLDLVKIRHKLKKQDGSISKEEQDTTRLYLEVLDAIFKWSSREMENRKFLARINTIVEKEKKPNQ